jgi:hypothetical protein
MATQQVSREPQKASGKRPNEQAKRRFAVYAAREEQIRRERQSQYGTPWFAMTLQDLLRQFRWYS